MLFLAGPKWRTGARGGYSPCPRLGEGKERAKGVNPSFALISHLPPPPLFNLPCSIFPPTSYIQLSATRPSIAKTHPESTRAPAFFLFCAPLFLCYTEIPPFSYPEHPHEPRAKHFLWITAMLNDAKPSVTLSDGKYHHMDLIRPIGKVGTKR